MNLKLPVTVSLWFKSSAINDEWDTMLGWNKTTTPFSGISVQTHGDGRIKGRIGDNKDDVLSTSKPDGDGKWHFVAISRDSSNKMKMYMDGKLEVSSTASASIGTMHNLYFGKSFRPDSYKEYFKGAIDEVRIYNRVLTAAEILQLYKL